MMLSKWWRCDFSRAAERIAGAFVLVVVASRARFRLAVLVRKRHSGRRTNRADTHDGDTRGPPPTRAERGRAAAVGGMAHFQRFRASGAAEVGEIKRKREGTEAYVTSATASLLS